MLCVRPKGMTQTYAIPLCPVRSRVLLADPFLSGAKLDTYPRGDAKSAGCTSANRKPGIFDHIGRGCRLLRVAMLRYRK